VRDFLSGAFRLGSLNAWRERDINQLIATGRTYPARPEAALAAAHQKRQERRRLYGPTSGKYKFRRRAP
jgi:hypothetical protein